MALFVQIVVNRGVCEDGGGLAAELVSSGREVSEASHCDRSS